MRSIKKQYYLLLAFVLPLSPKAYACSVASLDTISLYQTDDSKQQTTAFNIRSDGFVQKASWTYKKYLTAMAVPVKVSPELFSAILAKISSMPKLAIEKSNSLTLVIQQNGITSVKTFKSLPSSLADVINPIDASLQMVTPKQGSYMWSLPSITAQTVDKDLSQTCGLTKGLDASLVKMQQGSFIVMPISDKDTESFFNSKETNARYSFTAVFPQNYRLFGKLRAN